MSFVALKEPDWEDEQSSRMDRAEGWVESRERDAGQQDGQTSEMGRVTGKGCRAAGWTEQRDV